MTRWQLIAPLVAVSFLLVCQCTDAQVSAEVPPDDFSLARFRAECMNVREGWGRFWLNRKWKDREVAWEGHVSDLIEDSPTEMFYWITVRNNYPALCAVRVPATLPLPQRGDLVRFTGSISKVDKEGAIVKVRSLEIVKPPVAQ